LEEVDAGPVPMTLVAVTVNVYAVPFVRPATVMGLPAPVAFIPPGAEVTVYEVTALLPFAAGGVNVTVACPFPAVATPIAGAPGRSPTVTAVEGPDAGPAPTALVAVTVKVYEVPLVSPVTVIGLDVPVAVTPPGLEVTVYRSIALLPVDAGGVNATVAWALPGVTIPTAGGPGTVTGVTALEGLDAGPVPTAFVAVTVNV